jgi:hypothetical protein
MMNYDKYHPGTKLYIMFRQCLDINTKWSSSIVTMERNNAPAIHSKDTRRIKIEKYNLVKRGRKPWF